MTLIVLSLFAVGFLETLKLVIRMKIVLRFLVNLWIKKPSTHLLKENIFSMRAKISMLSSQKRVLLVLKIQYFFHALITNNLFLFQKIMTMLKENYSQRRNKSIVILIINKRNKNQSKIFKSSNLISRLIMKIFNLKIIFFSNFKTFLCQKTTH